MWSGWVDVYGVILPAAISVGSRATFYGPDGRRLLEANILDFDDDIYSPQMCVLECS